MITEPLSSFGVDVRYDEGCPVLHLTGEIDLCTAPELDALLGAVLDRSHDEVVLDVGDLNFIDGRGLTVIARSASRLQSVGGQLTVRAPSRLIQRLLGMTKLGEGVRIEPRTQDDGDAADIRQAAQIPADHEIVQAALLLVVSLAEAAVDGADAVTVSLAPHGQLTGVVAVDREIANLDRDQYAVGQGPCLEAAEHSNQIHIPATADEDRWPAFVPLARGRGVNSILSTPVRLGAGTAGALNMYSFREHAFAKREYDVAELLARGAAEVLDRSGAGTSDATLASRVRAAVTNRHTIALAQGILIGRDGVSADAAYTALRQESQQTSEPLRDIAAALVASAEGDESP